MTENYRKFRPITIFFEMKLFLFVAIVSIFIGYFYLKNHETEIKFEYNPKTNEIIYQKLKKNSKKTKKIKVGIIGGGIVRKKIKI